MPARRRHAFTIVELLVVIAIIALLMGLLLPAIARARRSARATVCLANVRSIALSQTMYADANHSWFPYWSGWQVFDGKGDGVGGDEPGKGWGELIVGFLDQGQEAFHDPARPIDDTPFCYFIAARYAWLRFQRQFSSVKESFIYYPSRFVMGGDCNQPWLYVAPYGTQPAETYQPDCDQDDASQPTVFFDGELDAHDGKSNIFFFDGHAAAFEAYDPAAMTWHATKMLPWSLEPPTN